ncbi:MAG: HD domain-containing protein [Candidatus Rokubacteria bacterium]|nr:HD domain-containing protein [Candidatus Rokubacteria bacterium]
MTNLSLSSTAALTSPDVADVAATDAETANHARRVSVLSLAIGERLRLPPGELAALGDAALLHDIGKLTVPDEILRKPTSLNDGEWKLMRRHAAEGARMVEERGASPGTVVAIRHHHERYDGSGYPDGLAGEDIPIAARILHVADALDSMLTTRVYRPGRPARAALAEIQRGLGSQFCPACVGALVALIAAGEAAELGLPAGALVVSVEAR